MQHLFRIFIAFLFSLCLISAFGQKVPDIKKKNFTNSSGKYFHNQALPAYIFEKTSGANSPPKLFSAYPYVKSDEFADYLFKSEGKKIIYFNSNTAASSNPSQIEIIIDGKPPKSKALITSSNKSIENNHIFYGQGLNIGIESDDDFSGVSSTYVAVNSDDFEILSGTISLQEEGDFTLNYFSVDNVGNVEPIRKVKISVDFTAPKTSILTKGKQEGNVFGGDLKIAFTREDNLSDLISTYYSINNEPKVLYNPNVSLTKDLQDGSYQIDYFSVDKVNNKEESQSFDFYLDKSSPIVTTDILGDKFIVNDKIYFSGRTKLKLTAVDNKSGVKELFYSLDKTNYFKYENPFYMPKTAGPSSIRYYAIDKLGNQGAGDPNSKYEDYTHNGGIVYVDLTGPSLSYEFTGFNTKKGNIHYLSKNTQVKLKGVDPESGVQKITYRLDSLAEEIDYEKPFLCNKDTAGTIFFYGYDNVNNRNINRINYSIDDEGPIITFNFNHPSTLSSGNLNTYPSNTTIQMIAKDAKSGIGIGFYSINAAKELPLKGPFTGFAPNKLYKIKVRVLDKASNQSISEITFKTGK